MAASTDPTVIPIDRLEARHRAAVRDGVLRLGEAISRAALDLDTGRLDSVLSEASLDPAVANELVRAYRDEVSR